MVRKQRGILAASVLILGLSLGCNKPGKASSFDSESSMPEDTTDPSRDTSSDDISTDTTSGSADTNTSVEELCEHPEVVSRCTDGWCAIPAGCYTMGSPSFEPCRGAYTEYQVQVHLTHPIVMAETEVTQGNWVDAGFPNPVRNEPNGAMPLGWVNWFEALAYCNALSEKEGLTPCYDLSSCTGDPGTGCPAGADGYYDYGCLYDSETGEQLPQIYECSGEVHTFANWYECPGYRLPTQAEMEYATRAGTQTATYAGDLSTDSSECAPDPSVEDIAWYCNNSGGMAHLPAGKQPNGWGLYDIVGNMSEWIDSVYTGFSLAADEASEGPLRDPMGSSHLVDTRRRQARGSYRSVACRNRSAAMSGTNPKTRGINFGFRPVRTVLSEEGVK